MTTFEEELAKRGYKTATTTPVLSGGQPAGSFSEKLTAMGYRTSPMQTNVAIAEKSQPLKVIRAGEQPQLKVAPPVQQPKLNVIRAQPTQTIVGPTKPNLFELAAKNYGQPKTLSPLNLETKTTTPKTTTLTMADVLKGAVAVPVAIGTQVGSQIIEKGVYGFAKDLARSAVESTLIRPVVRTTQAIYGARAGTGAEYADKSISAKQTGEQEITVDTIFGTYTIPAMKTGVAGIKQAAGEGLEAATWLASPAAVTRLGSNIISNAVLKSVATGEKIASNVIRQALFETVKQGAKTGAFYGGFGSLSEALQQDKNLHDTVKDTAIGMAFGGVTGAVLSGVGAGVAISRNKLKFIQDTFVKELVQQGIAPDVANRLAHSAGFIGKFNPKIVQLEETWQKLNQRRGMLEKQGMKATHPSMKQNKIELDSVEKQISNELQGGFIKIPGLEKKERGFIKSVKESPNVSIQAKEKIRLKPEEVRTYNVFTDKAAIAKAQARVAADAAEAERYVLTTQPDKEVATTALELMRRYKQVGNFQAEADVASHLAQEYTKAGQFVQAASMLDKLSPEGWVVYAAKRMNKAGTKISSDLVQQITTQAEAIQNIPVNQPYQKFLAVQELAGTIAKQIPRTKGEIAKDWAMELWTLPKTTAASFDLSAGLRQGLVPASSFPKEWGRAFKAQFKAAGSKEGYAELMNSVMNHQYFGTARDAGVAFSEVTAKLSGREDRFISTMAEKLFDLPKKIPVVGKYIPNPVAASNRAYTGLLNKLRMDVFSRMLEDNRRLGVTVNDKLLKDIARFVNDATGRGDWKAFRGSANNILQGVMFSPRLMYSRLNLLTSPVSYATAAPQVRKQVWKSLFTFGASTAAVLTLADLIPGVDVGKDPRSADFGKIKIGNTRLDIAGGFQQYIRIAAQIQSGKYVSTTTGKVVTLGEGYRPLTRMDVFLKGLASKQSPMAALLTTIMTGKNWKYEEVKGPKAIGKEFASKFIPLALNDIWEVYKNDPEILPLGFLGLFGVGVQSYPMAPEIEENKRINASANPNEEFEKLKKKDPIFAEKVKTAKIQENFTEFDWALTYMGVENGERAKFLVEYISRQPEGEKAKIYDDLRKKRLISDQVADQIRYSLNNPQ